MLLCRPLLIEGCKFDLRLFVMLRGLEPLTAYIYRDALVRLAAHPYTTDAASLRDPFVHQTVFMAIDRTVHRQQRLKTWRLPQLRAMIEGERGAAAWEHLWGDIHALVHTTLQSAVARMAAGAAALGYHTQGNAVSLYELFGFDVIVRDDLRPFLLEAPHS